MSRIHFVVPETEKIGYQSQAQRVMSNRRLGAQTRFIELREPRIDSAPTAGSSLETPS